MKWVELVVDYFVSLGLFRDKLRILGVGVEDFIVVNDIK